MGAKDTFILGIGMATPVGDCVAQTATSVRAGISRYKESSVYNKRFEPMTLALLPNEALPPLNEHLATLPGLTSRQGRMLQLAHLALKDLGTALKNERPLPLLLAGPEPSHNRPAPITTDFLGQLAVQTGILLDEKHSQVFASGRAGGLQAVHAAQTLLAQGHDTVLVGGVDSYLDLYQLGTLDQDNRVLAPGVMDGFCPGEGAGFLLLGSEYALQSSASKPLARLSPPGLAEELGHRYSKEPYKGDGLTQALTQALQTCQQPVRNVLCSLNGENFGVKEWGVAYMRNKENFDEGFRLQHPADGFGDIGAAFAPVLIGLSAWGMHNGTLPGPALVWCASEYALRGAVCVGA